MILFEKLQKKQQSFLNGKISQFMDAYIRQHKVWTANQMFSDFYDKIESEIKNGCYLPDSKYPELMTPETVENLKIKLNALKWLCSEEGKKISLTRINKKYQKDKPVADRKSPIVERVRFGLKWDEAKFFDINFGLKNEHRFKKTFELESIKYNPWSIEHVNKELKEKYDCTLNDCLSSSYLEIKFKEYWRTKYYSKTNTALIPEVCGFRTSFYYYRYNEEVFRLRKEIKEEITSPVLPVNFRFDFLLINYRKQKIALIELDGFENHKTRQQQTIDSIKRNTASNLNISLFNFTSKRIIENIESVFQEIEDYLK